MVSAEGNLDEDLDVFSKKTFNFEIIIDYKKLQKST